MQGRCGHGPGRPLLPGRGGDGGGRGYHGGQPDGYSIIMGGSYCKTVGDGYTKNIGHLLVSVAMISDNQTRPE